MDPDPRLSIHVLASTRCSLTVSHRRFDGRMAVYRPLPICVDSRPSPVCADVVENSVLLRGREVLVELTESDAGSAVLWIQPRVSLAPSAELGVSPASRPSPWGASPST